MYEMLRRGGGEDIPDHLREELLVEFDDPRRRGGRDRYGSGSEDDDGYRGERFSSRGRRRSRSRSWSRSRSRSRSRSDDGWDRDESMRVARDPRDYKVRFMTYSSQIIKELEFGERKTKTHQNCLIMFT